MAMLKPILIGSAACADPSNPSSAAAATAARAARRIASTRASKTIDKTIGDQISSPHHLLHHFVGRHDAPQIRSRRVLFPHFRPLRIVAVPRPRLEIAELLVHAIKLGERL